MAQEIVSKHFTHRRALRKKRDLDKGRRKGHSSGHSRIDYVVKRNRTRWVKRWEVRARST